ncbi:MAG: hypothetical protein IMY72_12460 [Bacteroidetes bacterium]|nr:hypothetical protein [Bacteroidota bacterium]
MTLLQAIEKLVENISVTDRQEENIENSFGNLECNLLKEDSNLSVKRVFLNGSYERDTIIRPLDDVDLFAVIEVADYQDEWGNRPNPQSVLTKFRNYLDGVHDYKGKVKQDRPCVTVFLSDKNFDVLPCLNEAGAHYIPNEDLSGWIFTAPETHTNQLNDIHARRKYKVKSIVKAIKYWKRDNNVNIPSFHVEEVAINVFNNYDFTNFEEGIRIWFENAEGQLDNNRFRSYDEYDKVKNKINKVRDKLIEAKEFLNDNKEAEAIKIWKKIFNKEFPSIDTEEAKGFSKSLSEGSLKYSATAGLSTTVGSSISSSKGFYGEIL